MNRETRKFVLLLVALATVPVAHAEVCRFKAAGPGYVPLSCKLVKPARTVILDANGWSQGRHYVYKGDTLVHVRFPELEGQSEGAAIRIRCVPSCGSVEFPLSSVDKTSPEEYIVPEVGYLEGKLVNAKYGFFALFPFGQTRHLTEIMTVSSRHPMDIPNVTDGTQIRVLDINPSRFNTHAGQAQGGSGATFNLRLNCAGCVTRLLGLGEKVELRAGSYEASIDGSPDAGSEASIDFAMTTPPNAIANDASVAPNSARAVERTGDASNSGMLNADQGPVPIISLDGRIGERKVLPLMQAVRMHWGGNSASEDEFVYEPPPGWIIYSYEIRELSKFGDSWYTPQLTSVGSNFAAKSDFEETIRNLEKLADKVNNKKAQSDFSSVQSNSLSWASAFSSTNNVLRIKWGGSSREKRIAGIVVDTDTAELALDVQITIARSLSPQELKLLTDVLESRIKRGMGLGNYFTAD